MQSINKPALLREAGETVYEIGDIVAGEGNVVYR